MRDYKHKVTRLKAAPPARSPRRAVARRAPPPPPARGIGIPLPAMGWQTKAWLFVGAVLLVCFFYIRYQVQHEPGSVYADIYRMLKGRLGEQAATAPQTVAASSEASTNASAAPASPVAPAAASPASPSNRTPARPPATARVEPTGPVANFFVAHVDKGAGQVKLLPVRRSFRADGADRYGDAVKSLLGVKPEETHLVNLFSSDTRLKRAWVENGVLLLDFNSRFEQSRYGHLGLQVQLQQVLWTVFDLSDKAMARGDGKTPAIEAVSILIDGKRKRNLGGEGIPLKAFYGREDLARSVNTKGPQV